MKERLIELDLANFPFPWTREHWLSIDITEYSPHLALKRGHLLFTTKVDGEIIAFTLFYLHDLDNVALLLKILVVPSFARKGYGKEILKRSIAALKGYAIYLEVSVENKTAHDLYEQLGFVQINYVKRFYSNGDDAKIYILMPQNCC